MRWTKKGYHVSFDILSNELSYSLRACLVARHYDHHDPDDTNVNVLSLVDKLHSMNIIQPNHKIDKKNSGRSNNSGDDHNGRSGGDDEDTRVMTHTTSDRISMSSFVIMLCICAMYAFPMEPEVRRLNKLFEMLNIK